MPSHRPRPGPTTADAVTDRHPYGLLVDRSSDADLVPLNSDDWRHLVLGTAMVALGLLTTRRREEVGHRNR